MDECKPLADVLDCAAGSDELCGRAVHFDRLETRVESDHGVCNQRLEPKYVELLSDVAFSFNLRRYFAGVELAKNRMAKKSDGAETVVGWCTVKPIETCVESAWLQRLILRRDEPLSNLAFNSNLRLCTSGDAAESDTAPVAVRRCNLKPAESRIETS